MSRQSSVKTSTVCNERLTKPIRFRVKLMDLPQREAATAFHETGAKLDVSLWERACACV